MGWRSPVSYTHLYVYKRQSGLWVTSQTSRLLRSYVEHHPDRRMVELQAHPLPIPDKVDSWLVATVC